MNNAFFGKTMETKPTYKSYIEITEDTVPVERIKATINLNKPVYLGIFVLDLFKVLMYDFYYNKLKQIFPNVQLLFTDTDSLCVSIEGCDDVYGQIRDSTIINQKW